MASAAVVQHSTMVMLKKLKLSLTGLFSSKTKSIKCNKHASRRAKFPCPSCLHQSQSACTSAETNHGKPNISIGITKAHPKLPAINKHFTSNKVAIPSFQTGAKSLHGYV